MARKVFFFIELADPPLRIIMVLLQKHFDIGDKNTVCSIYSEMVKNAWSIFNIEQI